MRRADLLLAETRRIQDHYDRRGREHGNTAAGVHWSSRESQDQRLKILAQIGPLTGASVLDFGCGSGRLLDVLRQQFAYDGPYTGFDLSDEQVRLARDTHPGARFERRDILTQGVGASFDYMLLSGVFGLQCDDNWLYMTRVLETLMPHCQRGLAFNALSNYVDSRAAGQHYADPEEVFRYCKEHLSPAVTLRHDYEVKPGVMPFDFTIYVYRSPHAPRAKHVAAT